MALVRTSEIDIAKQRLSATTLAIATQDYDRIKQIFTYLPPEDAAWIITNLTPDYRQALNQVIGLYLDKEILGFLDSRIRQDLNNLFSHHNTHTRDQVTIIQIDREEVIQQRVFQTIKSILDQDKQKLRQIFDNLQPADSANVLEFLTQSQRFKVVKMLDLHFQPKVLTFLDTNIRDEILEQLPDENLIHFLAELDYSEIVEILESVESDKQKIVLDSIGNLIDKEMFKLIKKSLFYAEGSAGRIMNPGLALAASNSIKEAYIKYYRYNKLPRESQIIYIYDSGNESSKFKLIGQIYTSELCRLNQNKHARFEPIYKYAHDIPCFLYTNTPVEEIGFLFKRYFVPEMPVVNPKNFRLMGTINANQAIDILDTSTEEELLTLAGLQEFDFHDSVARTIATRLQWLGVASAATIASVSVIHFFEDIIKDNPTLAVLMPIAPAIGGNAASQVLTVTVRALSNREIGRANLWRTIRKEVLSNLGSGLVIGLTIAVLAFLSYKKLNVCIILGISVAANICWAGLVGSGMPILLDKYDKDPALASAFLNVTTDIIGYAILLSMARIFVKF